MGTNVGTSSLFHIQLADGVDDIEIDRETYYENDEVEQPASRTNGYDDDDDDDTSSSSGYGNDQMRREQRFRANRVNRAVKRYEEALTAALNRRSFHLPGHDVTQDWMQYMCNTHPLFAICCANREATAFGCGYRFLVFLTSVMVSLVVVNAALWWSNLEGTATVDLPFGLSDGMTIYEPEVYLFTWMAMVHAIHDCVAWYGCSSASLEDGPRSKVFCTLWLVVWICAALSFGALLYTEMQQNGDDDFQGYDYMLVLLYASVELALVWFLWYFVVATVLFTGIFGCCGRIPILGGRPRDVKLEEQSKKKKKKNPATNKPVQMATLESLADYDQTTIGGNTIGIERRERMMNAYGQAY